MNVNRINSTKQTNLFTNLTSLAGNLRSRAVASLSNTVNTTLSVYQRVNQSVAGNWVINSIQENTLECIGALGLASLGEWWLGNTMESVGTEAGNLLGLITSIGAGILVGKAVYSSLKNRQSEAAKASGIMLGTTTLVITSMILPGAGSKIGSVMGRSLGSLMGAQMGSIIGGFAAIKLKGSPEVLINTQEPLNSYVIKTLQSSTVCSIVNLGCQFNPVIQAVKDQAIGALAYHSLTVFKPTIKSIEQGTLLDDVLPNVPSPMTQEEKQWIGKAIKNAYENPINQQAVLAFTTTQGMSKDLIAPFFKQDLDALYSQLSSVHNQSTLISEQQFMRIMMQGFENYFYFIFQNPHIQNAHQNLAAAFIKCKSEKGAWENSIPFQQAKQSLISILENELSQYVKKHSLQHQWDDLKEMLEKKNAQQLVKTIDKDLAQKLTDQFMARLEKLEEKLFAYPLTNEKLKKYVQELVNIHLQCFNFFLFREISRPPQTLNTETIRKNYQSFNALLASYYTIGANSRLPSGISFAVKQFINSMESLVDKQIKTAQLKEVKVGQLIEEFK